MGHWCRICFRHRPNEKFSGKGHRNHICKECSRRPKAERDAIDQEREIHGYYEQRNISRKNLKRLSALSNSADQRISALAEAVLAAGQAKPHKRKRLSFLARHHSEVMEKLGAVGLIIPPAEYRALTFPEFDYDCDEYKRIMFEQHMTELHLSGDSVIDPGEIEGLLLEYSNMASSKN